MEKDRMPTLFEILNRFSQPPLDLWSFYVFLKEHYGGVEYLEFWLDCAAHIALCKELAKALLRAKREQTSDQSALPRAVTRDDDPTALSNLNPADVSPRSSVLFNILRDDAVDSSTENLPYLASGELADAFPAQAPLTRKRMSTLSAERAQNKRDTVSRLSEILDTMQMPEYPDATATSPTRNPHLAGGAGSPGQFRQHGRRPSDLFEMSPYTDNPQEQQFRDPEDVANAGFEPRRPPQTSPPRVALAASYAGTDSPRRRHNPNNISDSSNSSDQSAVALTRRAVRDSTQRIIYTYLVPKSLKSIELPSDGSGWSMAEEIRQASTFPGGLENPRLFEPATTYVFDALEREALPAFYMYRALSNIQPVSTSVRLIIGLIALFGAFWLSFVFVLLDWRPRSHRCWVILPFAVGWYSTITSLYHIDPVLALTSLGEQDGGGLAKVQESFVKKMLVKRSAFTLVATVLLTAAFSVLFIFVPGHRL